LKPLILKSGTRKGILTPHLFNIMLHFLDRTKRKKERKKERRQKKEGKE
jgi:hypothetical protein